MANLATFGDLRSRVASRVGASRDADLTRMGEYCLESLRDVYRRVKWPDRRRKVELMTDAAADITITAATRGSDQVTATGLTETTHERWFLNKGWGNPGYEIDSISGTTITLERAWAEDDISSATAGKVYNHHLELPADVGEIITEEVLLLDSSGRPIEWKDRLTAAWDQAYPRSEGRPLWVTYADHLLDRTDQVHRRRLRVGPNAPDNKYALRVGYYRSYPDSPALTDPILLPPDLRDLAMWGALYRAYSEPPWLNEANAIQMKQMYETEMDISSRTSGKEGTSEAFVVDRFDEGSYW